MCEANAYMERSGKEELILEGVDIIKPEDGKLLLKNIFGEQKILDSKIKFISLVDHKIILEEN